MDLHKRIRTFIEENLIVLDDDAEFADSDNIFLLGYVNSLFAIRLLTYVEKEFGIVVSNEEMGMKNFQSVDSIASFVKRKLEASITKDTQRV